MIARTPRLGAYSRIPCRGRQRRARASGGRLLLQLLMQRLQHPRRFLASGNAKVETRFRLVGDRLRVVVAIVAALAAVLLGHGRHHPSAQWPAFSERHAIANRHGLVVPGRFTIIARDWRALKHSSALLCRERLRTLG